MPRNETALLRLDDVSGPYADAWGTTMSHAFAIAETLHHRRYTSTQNAYAADRTLALARFRHSPIGDDDTCPALGDWPCAEYRRWPTQKLTRAYRIIHRYLGVLQRAGEDY